MKKTVFISGGTRGIGRALALRFADEGWRVGACYNVDEAAAQTLAEELTARGCEFRMYRCDVAMHAAVQAMLAEAGRELHGIDVLVNNAGIAQLALLQDTAEDEWDRMFAVNVKGAYNCTKGVVKHMLGEKKGKIINVSSIWGIVGASCEVAYSASKAALIGMTKALAKELGPSGIQVNCVAPGVIDTDMNATLDEESLAMLRDETPLGRLGTPEEIASLVYFLAGDEADFITGQVISPNGGLTI